MLICFIIQALFLFCFSSKSIVANSISVVGLYLNERIHFHSLTPSLYVVFSEDYALHEPREARAVRRLRWENLRQILLTRR